MMKNKGLIITIAGLMCGVAAGWLAYSGGTDVAPAPYGPLPSAAQVEWQKMEMNMFCHFGPNTFTGNEWGDGKENEEVFAPSDLDCGQWASVAKMAGMNGIIITAKHHDGFCLWPNPESDHTVAQCSWREGKGDVLKELSEACHEAGLRFGIYISPWDRNAPTYGTDEYNDVFCRTLEDAHTRYGDIYEQWFDGACGEGPNGKRQRYDWSRFNAQVAKLQPMAVTFSDIGPGCRWVGNEQGKAPEECWSRLDTIGFAPGHSPNTDTLGKGNYNGACWIPAEVDVSIRPGWFYRDSEQPKSLEDLVEIYLNSVGHNALLLLNVPPDQRGLIAEADSLRLMELRKELDRMFAHDLAREAKVKAKNRRGRLFDVANLFDLDYDSYWATADGVTSSEVSIEWKEPRLLNYLMLQEYIPLGQRVERFHLEARVGGKWETVAEGTTIGYKKIVKLGGLTTDAIKLVIDKSRAEIVMNRVGVF